ncbi:shikimate dehydrogenase [Nitrosophilus kaiyonis]|uniref:shikimate dehydrogenase n=1 Tax=Nitrosophilus kaiyonis TaxID=2930200 RepID=UPI0024921328|nr:shikimate dehydrogenase [Nitrosophilus kaiyonis]
MKFFIIFGNPVAHSKSPQMHNFTFKSLNFDGCYTRYLLKDENLLKDKFFELNIDGANITVPFKEKAFEICDETVGIANSIKAVNTIIKKDNKLIGYNTDAPGFYESIKSYKFKNALILGAGGTAKAISEIFDEKNIDFTILNRSKKRLDYFINKGYKSFSWDDFKIDGFDLIINTTSAGLNDENLPAPKEILESIFKNAKYAVDVIYGKETPFLKMAKEFNLTIKDGKDMLLYQGVLAFEIFTDFEYEKSEIEKYMKEGLEL